MLAQNGIVIESEARQSSATIATGLPRFARNDGFANQRPTKKHPRPFGQRCFLERQ
jgi:hypothetical protein